MSMIKFSVSTWTLVVNNNMINGSIPAQINMLSNPVNFNMSYNRLCGIIPAGPVMDKFDGAHFYHNKCLCRSKDSCLQILHTAAGNRGSSLLQIVNTFTTCKKPSHHRVSMSLKIDLAFQ
ncbi:Polygalacturonase inhibitor 2 [Platanthera zijinensis]|uniref:Polygalacturonase inhibitor 2 n=1 Tax=Platanthera zijinensis TaxID=2320716 RepID=A0AAP0BRD6_9ASPA